MASPVPEILESIKPSRLRELCEARGLPTGGDQRDKRTRLARSMRGDLDEFLPLLLRSELAAYLGQSFVWPSGTSGTFTRVGQATRAQLEKLIQMVAADDPRAHSTSRPLGPGCPIRFWVEDDEGGDDTDEEAEDDEADEDDYNKVGYAAEKVFKAGVERDKNLMYYIKGGNIWAVPRQRPGGPKGHARLLVEAGIKMDYGRYLYFLDGDGDIARKRRRSAGAISEDHSVSVAHGAVVAARYRGVVHEPARVIKVHEESGDVLLHWHDNKFSEVGAEDIVRASDKPWTLEFLAADEVEIDGEEESLDDAFLTWLSEHMQTRTRATLLVKTLVNKLGRYTADQRLTARAVVDLGRLLDQGGYESDPDLRTVTRSPGIAARVSVGRRGNGSETSRPPQVASPVLRAPAPMEPPKQVLSAFEQAALRLQFLVQNAAAIRRPDEAERRRAVELAARDLALGAADQIRLRALAHQYASTHADLVPVVTQLRGMLSPEQRRQLLGDLRELCPSGDDLDDLVAVYATDLAVPLPEGPIDVAPVASSATPPWPSPPPPIMAALPTERSLAGGVRTNALLDSLFDKEH